jgi:hypothetical protein
VRDFVLQQLEVRNISPVEFDSKDCFPFSFSVKPVKETGADSYIIRFLVKKSDGGSYTISSFSVHNDFRRNHLGSIALKAILGMTNGDQADSIEIDSVQHDGPGFWSSFGALPVCEPLDLNEKIKKVLEEKEKELSLNACEELAAISRIAVNNPYRGWRMLSLNEAKDGADMYIKSIIFRQICAGHNMIIIPGEPGTHKILKSRLGVIPSFRPPVNGHPHRFQHILDALANK